MLYKAFAAITLIAAPIIVLLAQSVTPRPAAQPAPAVVQPSEPVAPSAPIAAPALSPPDPAPFGQPMPEAGQPFLTPGNGLPGAPSASESGTSPIRAISDTVPS